MKRFLVPVSQLDLGGEKIIVKNYSHMYRTWTNYEPAPDEVFDPKDIYSDPGFMRYSPPGDGFNNP